MQQFCVFGNPISHSKSPLLHNALFLSQGLQAFYGRVCLPTTFATTTPTYKANPSIYTTFHALNLTGANITIPFKQAAFEQADEVRGIAKQIGALNTWVQEDSKIIGYNTDAQGFFMCIQDLRIESALILGAGGSARAVACILHSNGIKTNIYNRSSTRFSAFKEFTCFGPQEIKSLLTQSYDIVINTTPAGLHSLQADLLPLDSQILSQILSKAKFAFDLVYGSPTPFLNLANKLGLQTQDGTQMLINQAALSSELFTFGECKLENILSVMREVL